MFSKFGRQIFSLYERRPILMNSIVGGAVYVAGEYTVQTQTKDVRFFNNDNWKKLAQLGALGAAENGVVMLTWYGLLTKFVGAGVGTNVVLLKCMLDQIFFATQQDFLFLGLCAYHDADALSEAFQEVKETFVTTWIVDCSLWPVVNFVGFAFVPFILQPTYMAFVSYFWQLYLSASAASDEKELSDAQLRVLFKALDTDNSNYIDAHELQAFFKQRKIDVSDEEVQQMIDDADMLGRDLVEGRQVVDDGRVSFEEFKKLATHGSKLKLKSSALWCSVREDIVLTKGVKHAMKRLEEMERHKGEKKKQQQQAQANKSAQQGAIASQQGENAQLPAPAQLQQSDQTVAPSDAGDVAGGATAVQTTTSPPSVSSRSPPPLPSKELPASAAISKDCVTVPTLSAKEAADKVQHQKDLDEDRAAAIRKATLGTAVLTAAALFRKLVFKL